MSDAAARTIAAVVLAAAVALAALTGTDDPARPGYGTEISHPHTP